MTGCWGAGIPEARGRSSLSALTAGARPTSAVQARLEKQDGQLRWKKLNNIIIVKKMHKIVQKDRNGSVMQVFFPIRDLFFGKASDKEKICPVCTVLSQPRPTLRMPHHLLLLT
jgi:hypothetical protein